MEEQRISMLEKEVADLKRMLGVQQSEKANGQAELNPSGDVRGGRNVSVLQIPVRGVGKITDFSADAGERVTKVYVVTEKC